MGHITTFGKGAKHAVQPGDRSSDNSAELELLKDENANLQRALEDGIKSQVSLSVRLAKAEDSTRYVQKTLDMALDQIAALQAEVDIYRVVTK